MSTTKQIAASRANGAKSKGPVTPEGKLVSSRNSTRHGLFAETIVLETEDTGRFLELVESLFQEHNPRTPTERLLVENIAAARWRQWRIWGMQKVAFDHEVASPSTTNDPPLRAVLAWRNSPDSMRTHELLLRFEIALDRQISRSLLRLQQLQAKPAQEKSAKDAADTFMRGPVAPHSDLRGAKEESAKGAARTPKPSEEPTASHSVLRGETKEAAKATASSEEKIVSGERTQQLVETVIRPLPVRPRISPGSAPKSHPPDAEPSIAAHKTDRPDARPRKHGQSAHKKPAA